MYILTLQAQVLCIKNSIVSVLSKLTIIIPTYKRHEYALRNIHFWSGKEVTLHILDGTDTSIPLDELNGIGSNIHYHHLPISIYDRFRKAVELIDTEYAVFQGDDEFFLPSALEQCITELERDEELVSCMGRCLLFHPESKGMYGRPAYTEMKEYAIMQDSPVERMVAHMNPYTCSTIYSVLRSPVWKQAIGSFTEQQFSVFSIEEYQVEMIVAFMGKSKVIPVLYWFRSDENPRIQTDIIKFNVWWQMKGNDAERNRFIDLMIDTLSTSSSFDRKTIRKAILKTSDTFSEWCDEQGIGGRHSRPDIWHRLTDAIKKSLPDSLKLSLNKLSGTAQPKADKTIYPFAEAINKLKAEGVTVNEDDVKQIEHIVMEFHQNKQKKEALVHG